MSDNPFAMFSPKHEFFVGIDSDGCVFDSMELKWKECFIPLAIRHWGLQAVSKYAREALEFVNLYSQDRGINRWPGVVNAVDWLSKWPAAMARRPKLPAFERMRRWLKEASVHSNATLAALIEKEPDNDELRRWMAWSKDVNDTIAKTVSGVPPFPAVPATLEKAAALADLVVVSGTPTEALEREWEEVGLRPLARMICGQELGTKVAHLNGCAGGGRYAPGHVLMIGDAPGDQKAAAKAGALFYPIVPGEEEDSWDRLHDEALGLFFNGKYAGDYADQLAEHFNAALPSEPSWVERAGCGCACGCAGH